MAINQFIPFTFPSSNDFKIPKCNREFPCFARLQSNQLDYLTSHRIKANSIKRQYNRPRAERRINEHTTELENFPSLLFAENPPRTGIDGPTNNLTAGYTAWWIYPPTCRIIRRELVNKLAGYKRGGAYYCMRADSTHSRGRANISSIEGGRRKRRQDRTMIPSLLYSL